MGAHITYENRTGEQVATQKSVKKFDLSERRCNINNHTQTHTQNNLLINHGAAFWVRIDAAALLAAIRNFLALTKCYGSC